MTILLYIVSNPAICIVLWLLIFPNTANQCTFNYILYVMFISNINGNGLEVVLLLLVKTYLLPHPNNPKNLKTKNRKFFSRLKNEKKP